VKVVKLPSDPQIAGALGAALIAAERVQTLEKAGKTA
jgi:activator of 2-hydroxyglutaryl-CoA dehydratase